MDTQAIRKKILDLALRGKLTEQLPEDGTAEELFQQIQQKKHSKPIKEKAKSEKPFQIPENWKWVHLNEIADTSLGKTLDKSKNTGDLCPYLCSINVHRDGIKLDTVKEARFTEEEKTKYRLAPGDLLICEGGDVGRTAIWNQNTVMYYQNALHRVRFYCNINPWFYRDLFEYYKAVGLLDWFSTGMTIKHLVQSSLYSLWLPLPPLSEQKRIVDKADSMIAILNTIDTLQTQYQDNLATLKSKIIDAGIQGKLTEQLPEDGTAEELYQQIQQEKLALEKAGKIKKSKPLTPVSEEEKPFDIPESWKWVRLINIIFDKPTNGFSPKGVDYPTKIKNLTLTATTSGVFKPEAYKYVDIPLEAATKYWLVKDDILIQRSNSAELVGTSCVFNGNDHEYIYPDLMMRIHVLPMVDTDYVARILKAPFTRQYYMSRASGSSDSMPKINQEIVANTLVPLPPLAEQKRIVAKLEELMPLCEG